ncbi:hypothetical protein A0128_12820 [Leptospira tipperaryensis]|uniref:Uncharacterized protein n=1 Tax=Leptospira tipperaryensis TaxID=2564040 RepID=A0A1D7UYH8_9LEPT|nr:hypothetical protein A0128_12820 [Leptospira tipperaryensis]
MSLGNASTEPEERLLFSNMILEIAENGSVFVLIFFVRIFKIFCNFLESFAYGKNGLKNSEILFGGR